MNLLLYVRNQFCVPQGKCGDVYFSAPTESGLRRERKEPWSSQSYDLANRSLSAFRKVMHAPGDRFPGKSGHSTCITYPRCDNFPRGLAI